MIANFQIGMEDLIAAQRNATVTAQYHKRNKLVMSVVGTILFMIVCVIIVKANFVIIAPFALILYGSIYYFVYEKAVILQTKRLVRNNPSMVPIDCKITLSEAGIFREFNNSTQNINWSQIMLAREDAERYFIAV